MGSEQIRTKIFQITDKDAFFKSIRPELKDKAEVSDLCCSAAIEIEERLKALENENYIPIIVSTDNSVIRKDFEESGDSTVSFSAQTLCTFLCYFFSKKSKRVLSHYQEHSIEEIKAFFSEVKILKKKKEHRRDYNDFIDLITPVIPEKFKGYNFKLSASWEWEILNSDYENKDEEPLNSAVPKKKVSSINEPYDNYFQGLQDEFKTIKLRSVGFEIPISFFINTPVIKSNEPLKKKLKALEQQHYDLSIQKEVDKNALRQKTIQIQDLTKILDQHFDISDVINLGKDIFIEASAGTGKSTMLRWIAYKYFCKEEPDYFPVFIQLKRNINNNIHELITEELGNYGLDTNACKNYKILLLLDGYDEFGGDKPHLFEELRKFKRNKVAHKGLQLVFSGRAIPKFSNHDLDLVIYNLAPFSAKDIQTLFINYLGQTKGNTAYDFITRKNLVYHFKVPLHIILLLSYFHQGISFELINEEEIERIILNRGELLSIVLIENFIRKYEGTKTPIEVGKWKKQKTLEVHLASYLAYYMTFKSKGAEVIPTKEAVSVLKKYGTYKRDVSSLEIEHFVNEFIRHGILNSYNDLLSFDKKEIKAFFTAYYLKDKITSYKKFLKYKSSLELTLWQDIEKYLLGIVNSDSLLKTINIAQIDPNVISSEDFIVKFELILKLFDQRNPPKIHSTINKQSLIQALRFLFFRGQLIRVVKYLIDYDLGFHFTEVIPLNAILRDARYSFNEKRIHSYRIRYEQNRFFELEKEKQIELLYWYLYGKEASDEYKNAFENEDVAYYCWRNGYYTENIDKSIFMAFKEAFHDLKGL